MRNIQYLLIATLITTIQIDAQQDFRQTGNASVYEDKFVGRFTANGEKYSHDKLTAAHLTLPFGTLVKVTNTKNNESVVVRINDRGPFAQDRVIDLSKSAAHKIGLNDGIAAVIIKAIGKNSEKQQEAAERHKQTAAQPFEQLPSSNLYYEIHSKNVVPTGFGVQIASYREPPNLLRLTSDIKKRYGHPIIVEIVENKDDKIYRLIVGNFSDKTEAEQAKKKLRTDFPECYVIDFSNQKAK